MRTFVRLVLCCAAAWSASALVAEGAASWAWPAGHGEILLAYGEHYAAGGDSRTHSGVDVRAGAGEDVRAPADAVVAFAGRVPAGDGATALAASLELPDGRKLTLLPLESVRVSAGEAVAAGETLGSLAPAGDASSVGPHLHVGLKSGSAYLDPAGLFGAPAEAVPAPCPPAATLGDPGPPPAEPPSQGRAAPRAAADAASPVREPAMAERAADPQPTRAGGEAREPVASSDVADAELAREPGMCGARPLVPTSGAALPAAAVAALASAAGWALVRRGFAEARS